MVRPESCGDGTAGGRPRGSDFKRLLAEVVRFDAPRVCPRPRPDRFAALGGETSLLSVALCVSFSVTIASRDASNSPDAAYCRELTTWSVIPLFGGDVPIKTSCCSALGSVVFALCGVIVGIAAAVVAMSSSTKSPSSSWSAWSIVSGSGGSRAPALLGSNWWTITPPGDAEEAVMDAAAIPSAVVLEALSEAAIDAAR